jgi:hypothetical protein
MPTSEHYRKSAEDCRRNAKEAHDVHERETLLRMAAQWDRLAEHKARKESEQEQIIKVVMRPLGAAISKSAKEAKCRLLRRPLLN